MYRMISCALALLLAGCVEKERIAFGGADGSSDDRPGTEPVAVSVAYLRSLYRGATLPVEAEIEVRGTVTANDRYGAFYGTIYMQDSTGGIGIKLDGERLFEDFPVGRPLRVRCRGLVLGDYGGTLSLGAASRDPAYANSFIPMDDRSFYLKCGEGVSELLPDTLPLGALRENYAGRLVAFDGVQFVQRETSLAWCDPERDTDRHLVDRDGHTLVVRTSARADFAAWSLPQGNGYIEGILERFNRSFQLRVVSPKNLLMESSRFGDGR